MFIDCVDYVDGPFLAVGVSRINWESLLLAKDARNPLAKIAVSHQHGKHGP